VFDDALTVDAVLSVFKMTGHMVLGNHVPEEMREEL
jgi:hypothetical protein